MNTTFRIDAASEAEAANQAPMTISGVIEADRITTEAITSALIEAEQTTTEAIFSWMESALRLAPTILQGFAGVFAVLYLLGATALGATLLFHTFSR